ncbi:ARM repeat-containing protein [Marasmius fiardii PR-910]|nr:ARM repeat-containing protein [Marasmius fiardii PR-910]
MRREPGMSFRSPLLEEFRSNKSRIWELKDLFGHIVEFSGDQHGSRFIQQKLETASSEEKQSVFDEIVPDNTLQLVQDVFGNYVIQKIFEHGTQVQKTRLANAMEGHVFPLSMQMYGCRVVQKAIEYILPEQQAGFVRELEPHIQECVRHPHGNHVIQKLIERVSPERLLFVNLFRGGVMDLATNSYGCRVLQRCLEHLPHDMVAPLIEELHLFGFRYHSFLTMNLQNYVIQFIIEHGNSQDKVLVISKLRGHLLELARHKFASNVCEKALQASDAETRRSLIDELLVPKHEGATPVASMMKDQFGNYVLQRAVMVADTDQRDQLIGLVRTQIPVMRRYSSAYNKHLLSIERLIDKFNTPS